MTYTAYLENIKAKTGRTAEWFRKEAAKQGLSTHAELLKWLKTEIGLGHGHANAMILYIRHTAVAKRMLADDARVTAKKSSTTR